MIFGKIDYLNLLPFHMFLKRRLSKSYEKKAWQKRGSYPANINKAFKMRHIDAAVISSIKSQKCKCSDFGIIARKKVQSVLLIPGESREDKESNTSNKLASILGLKGAVLIGDKALRYYNDHPDSGIDLAQRWNEKEHLPFVFARLCALPKYFDRVDALGKEFFSHSQKIPYSIRKKEAIRHGITIKQLDDYLSLIHYDIKWREKKALKRFLWLSRRKYN